MSSRVGLGLVLVAAGVLWLLHAADVLDLPYRVAIGLLLALIGLVIVATPGRHALLALAGLVVLLAGLPALVVDEDVLSGGVGEAREAPSSPEELEPYRHGVGKLTVDLSGLELEEGERVTVEASLGVGELVVLVPRLVDVSVEAHVGIGNAEVLGETEAGVAVYLEEPVPPADEPDLVLELDVGLGNLRVERADELYS